MRQKGAELSQYQSHYRIICFNNSCVTPYKQAKKCVGTKRISFFICVNLFN